MIYVIDFDPIGIYTCLAPQNDRQYLNFVKYIYVDGKKMARNGSKIAKRKDCDLFCWSVFITNSSVNGILYEFLYLITHPGQ